jgi:hypothetical protein
LKHGSRSTKGGQFGHFAETYESSMSIGSLVAA